MRVYKLAAFVAMALWSCSKEPRESGGLVLHTISAGIGETTKTQLATEYSSVFWSVGDEVDVWVGETAYEFTSTLKETANQSLFQGLAPADMGTSWVLVYPKGASTGKSGSVISATLPATQTARANSYDPSAALLYGVSRTTSSTTCKHLYSGIRIMFTQAEAGIRRVSLRGNAGEKIAGDFTFDFSGETPSISGGTSETIVLNAPGGGTFETGKWYFILCLPTVFSRGITITADNGSQVGYFTTGTSTTFSRAKIKNKENFTINKWADIGSAGTVHYGPANTICLRKGASTTIDVTPWLTTAGWQRCGMETTAVAALPDGSADLWGDSTASLSGTTLTLNAAATEGSSLVAITKNGTIIWSYLIWVTEEALSGNVLPPLGGQLYFQWGRKDPLSATSGCVENKSSDGLSYSISHPCDFIKNGDNCNDWFTDNFSNQDDTLQDDTLWGEGGGKTVWDPCPSGYRVPSRSDGVSGTSDNYGYLYNFSDVLQIYPYGDIYWSRDAYTAPHYDGWEGYTPHQSYYTPYTPPGTGYRYIAYPVRCIKE